ncbi:C69 family dipeptidase [candidate division KSB1 bacterium]|nr:C69 family dipeptidase [candidate division KSB1 bacterium]
MCPSNIKFYTPASCDTIVATGSSTRDGVMLFGKNSDREPNEAHQIVLVPAQHYPKGSIVKCTYIDIPRVEHTYALLLAKPFWIWGAEMGVNEKGVAIGNEAVFTKIAYEKKPGLIGMDFLRLALERAATASEAVALIIHLLEQYGQGGKCGFEHKLYYHNSFLIADPGDAWVLETAGKMWAAKQIFGVYSISNGITIEKEWDKASSDLVDYAIAKKWCKSAADFNFAKCYSDYLYTTFSDSRNRRARTMQMLSRQSGDISVNTMMSILRDHGETAPYSPDRGLFGANVCMHAGFGPVRVSQTTGSLVCHLHPVHPTFFVTGTAAPCTSIFKPIWIDSTQPATTLPNQGRYDGTSLFWRHERLHRHILYNYSANIHEIDEERDHLEREFIQHALDMAADTQEKRDKFSDASFAKAASLEDKWSKKISAQGIKRQKFLQKCAWRQFNKKAQMPE